MPRPLVFLFPGQNSRYPAMLEAFADEPESRHWLERASDVVGRDLVRHYRAANPGVFARNRDVQIGVFLANHLHWQRLERAGLSAAFSAGLSLGEYNHLVHIGALEFDEAIAVLEARGAAYERGPAGKMAALFPAEVEDVEPILGRLGFTKRLGVAMINSPRQLVLAGDTAAVDTAAACVEDARGCATVVVDPAVPMHSPLFRTVADEFRPALDTVRWRAPRLPYVSNVSGRIIPAPAPDTIADALARHVYSTVRWRDCIDAIAEAAGDAAFVEAGPKAVLTGLFGKRWRSPTRIASDAAGSLPAIAQLAKEGYGGLRPAAGGR
jgi:[acyl-carrier-protein] S-malonyltransferase